ncbi:MAG: HEAT repeat domain-containing protein [candidate division NC10 bacterium]|nr:HEAT repeat domain-containing protein [candidate division NC10 bacterium]
MVREGEASGASPAVSGSTVLKVLEDLLVTLRRSSKDLAFYPPEHPMLKRSMERAVSQLHAAVGIRAPLAIAVSRGGFTFDGQPIGRENQQLGAMAGELFVRRIQQLFFARDIDAEELAAFLRMITSDPKHLLQQGGPAKVLGGHAVHRIQVNEFDFRRHGETSSPAEQTSASAGKGQGTGAGGSGTGTAKSGAAGEAAGGASRIASLSQGAVLQDARAPGLTAGGRETVGGAVKQPGQPGATSTAAGKPPSPGTAPSAAAPQSEQTVEALVQRLEQEAVSGRPAGYEWAASRLEAVAGRAVRDEKLKDVLASLQVFLRHQQAADFKAPMRERAARAVESIAAGDTVPYLVRHLGAPTGGVSTEDFSAVLVSLGSRVVPPLMDRLATGDQKGIREHLAPILLRLMETAQSEVAQALQEMGEERAVLLASIFGEIGGEGCVTLLAWLFRHRDARVRLEAVRRLGRIGGASTHRPLLQALRDSDPAVLELAVGLVGKGRMRLATPTLLRLAGQRALAGKPFAVRKAAVAALGAMGEPGSVPTLTGLLRTRTWFRQAAGEELRLAAALALLEMGRPEAREVVEAGADSRRADVRRACDGALRRVAESSPATE